MQRQPKSFLIDYYKEQVKDIDSLLKVIPGRYKIKDIHKLRVRIKRLKAIFRLLEFVYPSEFKAKDHYHLFKPVFKTAGLIREGQINLSVLKKYTGTKKLRKSFSKYTARIRPEWEVNLDSHIQCFNYNRLHALTNNVEELVSRNTEPELVDLMAKFINSEIGRINSLLRDADDLTYIHEVRIILKNIKPLLGLLWTRDDNVFTKSHYDNLSDTETYIGNWHDRRVLSESLKLFFNAKGKTKDMYDEYSKFKEQQDKYKKSINVKIRQSLTHTLELFSQYP
ncbi:MAG: CHAD domain-containing protein [Bacteroidota bacterium]